MTDKPKCVANPIAGGKQIEPIEGDVRFTPCYCGGKIKEVFQSEKIGPMGKSTGYVYKHPRWQIVNCFQKSAQDYVDAVYGPSAPGPTPPEKSAP